MDTASYGRDLPSESPLPRWPAGRLEETYVIFQLDM
jgi:hypothetical protein